jgi:hypothetical protein
VGPAAREGIEPAGAASGTQPGDPCGSEPDAGPEAVPTAGPPREEGPAQGPEPGLAERLRRARPGGAPRTEGLAPDESALAAALGAERLAPGVLRLERWLPVRTRHGRALLGPCVEPLWLPLPPNCLAQSDPPPPWLALDTETSGLAGGTGTWAFLTGLLKPTEDGWRLCQLLLTRLDAEPAYLALVADELTQPARLLTYNGRSFDAPLLSTRFRLAAQPDPIAALPHLDLLAPMRRAFASRWPDCRLATAESRLLGVTRRDDLPGSAAPLAWLGWLRGGPIAPLAAVLRHNRDDLLSLAALLPALDRAYLDPAAQGADPRAVAAAQLAADRLNLALAILERARPDLDSAGLLDLARLHRRAADWPNALAIWEPLAAAGDPDARESLARWHEHRSGDLAQALRHACALPPGEARERRRARIEAKLARTSLPLPFAPAQTLMARCPVGTACPAPRRRDLP